MENTDLIDYRNNIKNKIKNEIKLSEEEFIYLLYKIPYGEDVNGICKKCLIDGYECDDYKEMKTVFEIDGELYMLRWIKGYDGMKNEYFDVIKAIARKRTVIDYIPVDEYKEFF